ncbi:MAG: PhzF family phenazine biosynthesis protein [Candidatus Thorarchaeota archaeon]|nr:PhzF family phenazine biosynthesis protein [Candidatus Thorarchaeota archaeon]
MKAVPYLQTSVFTDTRYRFGGNQLATFWDHEANSGLTAEEMQGIALEMHFSETSFVFKPVKRECVAKVRIFTPGTELPFAGHPTLGTAFVLRQKNIIPEKLVSFRLELGIGPVEVSLMGNDTVGMKQPPSKFYETCDRLKAVAEALGLSSDDVARSPPPQFVGIGLPFLIVRLKTLDAVRRASPNSAAIESALHGLRSQEILVFSQETTHPESTAHMRVFAPTAGVLEDPATGSAAGPLAAFLYRNSLLPQEGMSRPIVIEQGYEISRPSRLVVEIVDTDTLQAFVYGAVRLTAEGSFFT